MTDDNYRRRIESEAHYHMLGKSPPWLTPHDAAFLRRLGQWIEPSEVIGDDTNKLSRPDADFLRDCGLIVDPEEVE